MMRCALTLALAPTLAVATARDATFGDLGEITIDRLPTGRTSDGGAHPLIFDTRSEDLSPVIPILNIYREELQRQALVDEQTVFEAEKKLQEIARKNEEAVRAAIIEGSVAQRGSLLKHLTTAHTNITSALKKNHSEISSYAKETVRANALLNEQLDHANYLGALHYARLQNKLVVKIQGNAWDKRFERITTTPGQNTWQHLFSYVEIEYLPGDSGKDVVRKTQEKTKDLKVSALGNELQALFVVRGDNGKTVDWGTITETFQGHKGYGGGDKPPDGCYVIVQTN